MSRIAAATFAALTLCACAPVVAGGPPMALDPALRDQARLGTITMSSDWLMAEDDFSDTFTDEVGEELRRCMTGDRTLNLRLHVDDLDRAGRLETVVRGDGMHTLAATAEFVDPQTRQVVGRYPIRVATQAGGAVPALLGDRQMMVSEEYGRALCEEAFGRNPRRSGPWNATRG
ncbi:hypothetical protein Q0812_05825 [Brevundimonas sp. 2R-24]|uniref:Lipoprotein n=1 Tax=Peiella sedimenti TaxID=3061083 RepID=A0ABT8SK44_9CAUL|nr:hypothetical protein [Caulobacteraceae bacterium XZ-24]